MDNRIRKVYDLIKRNYQDRLLLSDLATKVDLSPFFFHRLFKKELSETPAACLSRIRLQRAAHLMRMDPNLPIAQIATDCGFSSLSVFSRAFSARFGMSPLAFTKFRTNHPPVKIKENLKVSVCYQKAITVLYSQASLNDPRLLRQFDGVISFCELNGITTTKRWIGILTHMAFHAPKDNLNYYAGTEITGKYPSKYNDRIFEIPEGKYACIETEMSYLNMRDLIIQFKLGWLDQSDYTIKDIFAFEEISPENKSSDYPFFRRKVYLPIIKSKK